jgi:hypothetical protein
MDEQLRDSVELFRALTAPSELRNTESKGIEYVDPELAVYRNHNTTIREDYGARWFVESPGGFVLATEDDEGRVHERAPTRGGGFRIGHGHQAHPGAVDYLGRLVERCTMASNDRRDGQDDGSNSARAGRIQWAAVG